MEGLLDWCGRCSAMTHDRWSTASPCDTVIPWYNVLLGALASLQTAHADLLSKGWRGTPARKGVLWNSRNVWAIMKASFRAIVKRASGWASRDPVESKSVGLWD